jgi:hypothetical protein
MNMEVVAGAASVSQLVAYSFSSLRYLQQLYTEIKICGSAYRNEEASLSLLLNVIRDLEKQGVSDSDPILPILIDVSRLACEILHLLQPRRLLGFNWTPFTKQDELKSAFRALDRQQKLLHLRVSGEALTTLRAAVNRQGTDLSLAPSNTMPTTPSKVICPISCSKLVFMIANSRQLSVSNNNVDGVDEVVNRHDSLAGEIDVNDNTICLTALQQVGNREQMSEERMAGIKHEQLTLVAEKASNTKSDKGKEQTTTPATSQGAAQGGGVLVTVSSEERANETEFMRRKRVDHYNKRLE